MGRIDEIRKHTFSLELFLVGLLTFCIIAMFAIRLACYELVEISSKNIKRFISIFKKRFP